MFRALIYLLSPKGLIFPHHPLKPLYPESSLNLVHNKSITKSVFYFMSVHSKVILGNKQLEQLNLWKWVNLYLQVAHRTLFDDGKSVRLRK